MALKVFNNKISAVAIFLMALVYLVMITRAIVFSFNPPVPELQPITLNKVELVESVLTPGKPLVQKVDGTVNIRNCDTYTIRSITSRDKNPDRSVWFNVLGIQSRGTIEDIIENKKIVVVEIPTLSTGNYTYRAEIHEICNGKSYITLVPLLDFTIVEKK